MKHKSISTLCVSVCIWTRFPSWSNIVIINKVVACELSRFSHVQLFVTPWAVACQAPLSMGFSTQEYWSGVPLPSPLSHWGSPNKAVSTQQKGFPSGSVVKNPPAMQELQEAWV